MAAASRQAAEDYLQIFPAYGLPAVRMLAVSGAPVAELDESLGKVLAAMDDADVATDLNGFAYDALEMGAMNAAREAATRQLKRQPNQANAYDTLAQVHAARGEYDEARKIVRAGLTQAVDDPHLSVILHQTLASIESPIGRCGLALPPPPARPGDPLSWRGRLLPPDAPRMPDQPQSSPIANWN